MYEDITNFPCHEFSGHEFSVSRIFRSCFFCHESSGHEFSVYPLQQADIPSVLCCDNVSVPIIIFEFFL